jgi:hypothetical protein
LDANHGPVWLDWSKGLQKIRLLKHLRLILGSRINPRSFLKIRLDLKKDSNTHLIAE